MRRLLLALALASGAFAGVDARAQTSDDDTLASLGRVIDTGPTADAYDAYAQAAFRARRWDEAIARLKVGVAQIPTYHQGWYKLAYAYRQKRAFSESAMAYRKFAELEPGKPDPFFGLAAALQGAGDNQGAADAYRRYIELEKAPEKQKFVDQARAEIAKLSVAPPPVAPAPVAAAPVTPPPPPTMVPPPTVPPPLPPQPSTSADGLLPPPTNGPSSSALALRAEADKQRRAGRLPEAAAAFERALAADPGNLDLHVELGDVYFAQRRYADAARIFRAAVDRDAGYALGWYNLAHAWAQAGDQQGAIQAYRSYIRLRPTDPDPYYGLGHACRASGDNAGAIEAFRTYLRMERRPELQRWIDRARKELRELGATAERGGTNDLKDPFHGNAHDLKNPFEDRAAYASQELVETEAEHARIARELAADDILPIDLDEEVRPAEPTGNTQRDKLARYAGALAAYRLALEHEASQAATLYQRGADRLMSADVRGAQRVWAQAPIQSRTVEEARQRLDKARQALTAK